jgi:hypothetical protein
MSTQPDDLAPPPEDDGAAPPNPDTPPVDPPEDTGADHPYAPLAETMGWVPRDKFQGNAEDWKDPEAFIRAGRDIQRDTSAQLKAVRAELETVARTSASIVEQQVNERVEALRIKHAEAVEAGDTDAALRLANDIARVKVEAPTPSNAPSPEAAAFAERNSTWFQKPGNEYATARAIEICNTLAAQGYKDHGTQLRIAEQRLRQEMPQLFKDGMNGQRKDPPGVNAPGSRGAPPSNRQKGFADMPKEAQDIARDMVERKVIKSTDDYTRNYFANLAGKA